jgi:hypothetical protein
MKPHRARNFADGHQMFYYVASNVDNHEEDMTSTHRMLLTACAALALAACTPRPKLNVKDVKGVAGMSMDQVQARLGGPYVVTNAGDSVWWDYNDIQGNASGTCQVVFKNDVASEVRC